MRTSILGIIVSAAVGSFAFFGVASPAYALSVVIVGVGQWGDGTLSVPGFSEPGATFAFEVVLPQPIPANPADGTSFDYVLDNKGIIDEFLSPHVPVEFFDAADAGLFDLSPKKNFEGSPVVISLYGPQIVFPTIPGAILPGDFNNVAAGVQMEPASGTADIRVSPLTATQFGGEGELLQLLGVPEPSTWVMMALGFAVLALAGYRRSCRRAIVA